MDIDYLLGLLCAILAGALNAFGAIMEKSAVNRVPAEARRQGFMRRLLRNPVWWSGLALSIGAGTAFNLTAQRLIGPALVPGLTASGMIVLAVASTRLIGEKLRPSEYSAIVLMALGIGLLGYSHLDIPAGQVDLLDAGLLTRIGLFSLALGLCWLVSYLLALPARREGRGLILAASGAFPFCLSNLWILPMLLTIGPVFAGKAGLLQVGLFVLACLLLVGTNMFGIRQVQEAYRFAPASKVQPIQQVPTQIVPILIYFFVYQRQAGGLFLVLGPAGVLLIILAGFVLGRRKSEWNDLQEERRAES